MHIRVSTHTAAHGRGRGRRLMFSVSSRGPSCFNVTEENVEKTEKNRSKTSLENTPDGSPRRENTTRAQSKRAKALNEYHSITRRLVMNAGVARRVSRFVCGPSDASRIHGTSTFLKTVYGRQRAIRTSARNSRVRACSYDVRYSLGAVQRVGMCTTCTRCNDDDNVSRHKHTVARPRDER